MLAYGKGINLQRLQEKRDDKHIKKMQILIAKGERHAAGEKKGTLLYTPEMIVERAQKLGVSLDYLSKKDVVGPFIADVVAKIQKNASPAEAPAEETETASPAESVLPRPKGRPKKATETKAEEASSEG